VRAAEDALRPYAIGRNTLNFVERDALGSELFEPAAYERLVLTRRRWDPERRFLASPDIS
jgi:hypothetical protein